MAATACVYAYEGARPPPPPLMPAPTPARSSQVPEPPFDCAVKPASPDVHPPLPPPLPWPSKAPSSLFSRYPGLCTEGLGSESSGDVDLDDLAAHDDVDKDEVQGLPCKRQQRDVDDAEPARAKISGKAFPPPISVIGAGGKPWLYLRPHRADGRLVLREVRIPSQELLQARREDGRFKLHFTQPKPEEGQLICADSEN